MAALIKWQKRVLVTMQQRSIRAHQYEATVATLHPSEEVTSLDYEYSDCGLEFRPRDTSGRRDAVKSPGSEERIKFSPVTLSIIEYGELL
jgi:hypothetical protein